MGAVITPPMAGYIIGQARSYDSLDEAIVQFVQCELPKHARGEQADEWRR
jgi:hypothetical protein